MTTMIDSGHPQLACRDWFEALESTDLASLSASPDAQPAAASTTHSLLAAALVLLPAAPATTDVAAPLSQSQLRLQAVATQLLPLLLTACHRQPPQLVLIVSLATALIERLVPAAAWLPLVRSHLHFGNLLQSMLLSLHSAAQQAAAVRRDAAAQHSAQHHAVPAGTLPALPTPQQAQQDAQQDAQQVAGLLSPLAAASVEEAVLLLALQLAQTRSGAELLVEQGAVAHALALGCASTLGIGFVTRELACSHCLSLMVHAWGCKAPTRIPGSLLACLLLKGERTPISHSLLPRLPTVCSPCSKWLLVPEGGDLMGETPAQRHGTPGTNGVAAAAGTSPAPGGTGVVDYSNAYRQDGSPNPAHRLWCCVLSLMAVLLAALPGHAAGGWRQGVVNFSWLQLSCRSWSGLSYAACGDGKLPLQLHNRR